MKFKHLFQLTAALFLAGMMMFTFTACGDDDDGPGPDPDPTPSDAKDILSFVVDGVTATISGTNITATVSFEADITSLAPTITVSEDATVSPASGVAQDFSSPVTYTVTAEDESTQTYTATITQEDPPQLTVTAVWERNLKNGNIPDWFGANTNREVATDGEYVFAHANNDKIRILNIGTGEEIDPDQFISGTQNFSGGSIFANLMGIDTDDMGHIIGSTLAGNGGEFRVYRWEDKDDDQGLAFERNPSNGRKGDNIFVTGNIFGNAYLYAPSFGSSNIFRYSIVDGELSGDPTVIQVGEALALGGSPGVFAYEHSATSNLIVTGSGLGTIYETTSSGEIVGQLPESLKDGPNSLLFDALDVGAFEIAGRKILAATSTNYSGNSSIGTLFIVDYTDGWDAITDDDIVSVLFNEDDGVDNNVNATGGIAFTVNGDSATVYALISNFGIGAYTVTYE